MSEQNETVETSTSHIEKLPPTTFNYERVWRPTNSYEIDEELFANVRKLVEEGRLRTALDKVLEVLDKKPDDEFALRMAMQVANSTRTVMLHTTEPLEQAQLRDSRLDPIFVVCSRCHSSWTPDPFRLEAGFLWSVINDPIGLQCYNCGYVICRDCYEAIPRTVYDTGNEIPRSCPNCYAEELSNLVYPTGRPPRQMQHYKEPITHVIVYREGPITPDPQYIEAILKEISPDTLQGRIVMQGVAIPHQWNDDEKRRRIEIHVMLFQKKYKLKVGFSNVDIALTTDEWGNCVHIAKIMVPSELADSISSLLNKQIDQLIKRNSNAKQLLAELHLLLQPEILRYIQIELYNSIEESAQTKSDFIFVREFGQLTLILSIIPTLAIAEIKSSFPISYTTFLFMLFDEYKLGAQIGNKNIAHLLFCHDQGRYDVYLTFFPKTSGDVLPILPTELLDQEEKRRFSLRTGDTDTSLTPASPYGVFWFDWTIISKAGHRAYGRYAYQQILPIFARILPEYPYGRHMFFDGDCLLEGNISIPVHSKTETGLLKLIKERGIGKCYVIAVYGKATILEKVHHELVESNTIGYLGKTSLPGMSFDEFYNFTKELKLPFAVRIHGMVFEKDSFDFLNDNELRALGFVPKGFEY